MSLLIAALSVIAILLIISMDFSRKGPVTRPLPLTIGLLAALNLPLLGYWLYHIALSAFSAGWRFFYLGAGAFLLLYFWLRLSLFPVADGIRTGLRCKVMIGGRFIALSALWGILLEVIVILAVYRLPLWTSYPLSLLITNAVYAAIMLFFLLFNGAARMFFTSRKLSVFYRVVMLLSFWIPFVNLVVLGIACRLVFEEYDFACNKEDLRRIRAHSNLCDTKYPLIMVHGVLFRDLKYFNYWGRIPKELARYGARVYYGNQEAVGTIADNGRDIKQRIFDVMAETGSDKVNIIAHSKGGLDARYVISALGMGDYVASLTTISTPHRGCRFMDFACHLPERFYRFLARIFNAVFKKLGDQNPDFYTATRQFTTGNSIVFNRDVPDCPGVYYQSYMTKMKNAASDWLLSIPYLIIKTLEGANDGLVSEESAKWGHYRGIITAKKRRGISHADIIDLKREDYKGFDVIETYVGIVSDLKGMGF
ncbi:MAG: triacylglycerol lipase [Oscillospiraceae bacterium]|nr:triacylglycerol lipase [Oscillospiraceae bacterium]